LKVEGLRLKVWRFEVKRLKVWRFEVEGLRFVISFD